MPNNQAVSDSIAASARAALSTVEPRPGVPKPDPIMVADHVRRSFGGLTAVNVEHVEIQRGAITALIGPNGAGKTTFFNLITGFDDANEGTWTFNDRQVAGTAPYKLARIGMVRTFQLTKALSRMTVIDNMRLGAKHQTGERFFAAILPFLWNSQEKSVGQKAMGLLERFNLHEKVGDFATSRLCEKMAPPCSLSSTTWTWFTTSATGSSSWPRVRSSPRAPRTPS